MLTRRLVVGALALLAGPALAQTAPPLDAPLPRVAFETSAGRFVVEVESKRAPITAANFLRYVDQKRLDGIKFYRTCKVADHFGFVQFGVDGDPKRILPPIRHESTTLTGIRHLDGTLSMPRLAPGSARGEFTISVGDQPGFDADPSKPGDNFGYAAFAHVVEGMDVVVKIFDAPIAPGATLRGLFKGEIPAAPVRVLTVRRVRG
jgi:peptidyl-prolyl cis-trans isomerase A (cyclophilin A)